MPTEAQDTPGVNEQEIAVPAVAEEQISQEKPQEPKENSKEYNWRRMEQKMGELERRNAELVQAISKVQSQKEEPQEPSLEADDLVTYGQLEKLAVQKARQVLEEEFAKREKAKLPEITKAQYADYDLVVTPENVEKLITEDPDLEYDISVARNPYARAYKAIKTSGFYSAKLQNRESDDKIAANASKPVSGNSLGKQRPLSHANAYAKGSPELFEEMQKYRAGHL